MYLNRKKIINIMEHKADPKKRKRKSGKRKFFSGNDLAEMSFFCFRFLGEISAKSI